MTKELVIKNLKEALESKDCYLEEDEIEFIVEVGYEEMKNWTYKDFNMFVFDILGEWGDYMYVLREYDFLPNLEDEEESVKAWFSDHPQAMQDCITLCDIDIDNFKPYDVIFNECIDIEDIHMWLRDHKEAYRDCIRYIRHH